MKSYREGDTAEEGGGRGEYLVGYRIVAYAWAVDITFSDSHCRSRWNVWLWERSVLITCLPSSRRKTQHDLENFRKNCLKFYENAAKEMQDVLPLKDEVFHAVTFIDPVVIFYVAKHTELKPALKRLCERFKVCRAHIMFMLNCYNMRSSLNLCFVFADCYRLRRHGRDERMGAYPKQD